jgi:hypothetical protein
VFACSELSRWSVPGILSLPAFSASRWQCGFY